MNILAHAYLSNRHEGIVIGNFIGDFIKGDPAHPRHRLTSGEITGVRIHRAIDTFTDAHLEVEAVRELLRPRCHKYAGAGVDIFFDHFLAVNFHQLTGESLTDFTNSFYKTLQQNVHRLPPTSIRMLEAMVRYDWLMNYQTLEGIDRSLKGVSRRTVYPSGLDTAILDLERYYPQIEHHFKQFWPQLVGHVRQMLASLKDVG
jgi:acyl carrier protein phosphodiesterase